MPQKVGFFLFIFNVLSNLRIYENSGLYKFRKRMIPRTVVQVSSVAHGPLVDNCWFLFEFIQYIPDAFFFN